MKKTITTMLLTCTMILPSTVGVFANEINEDVMLEVNVSNEENLEPQEEVEPRLSYDHKCYLSTNGWSNVVNDNNWLNAKLKVTNESTNSGDIYVRVMNDDSKVIVEKTLVSLGDTVTLKKIDYNAGKYRLQAKAKDAAGNYTLIVKD